MPDNQLARGIQSKSVHAMWPGGGAPIIWTVQGLMPHGVLGGQSIHKLGGLRWQRTIFFFFKIFCTQCRSELNLDQNSIFHQKFLSTDFLSGKITLVEMNSEI